MSHFSNAQRLGRMHPETFGVHNYEVLSTLTLGDFVTLCSNKERFWVIITEVNGKRFKGKVDNELLFNDYELGEIVSFTMTNIYDFSKSK